MSDPTSQDRSVAPSPGLSVAICTWNRADLLRQTLQRLSEITPPPGLPWELLVVNNNCSDATDEVVAAFEPILPVRLTHEPKPGLSHARNAALAACRHDIVVFTDDDVLVAERWLTGLWQAVLAHPEAVAFGGPVEPWFPVPPAPELVAAFPAVRNGFCGLDHRRDLGPLPAPLKLVGANMAFRRSRLGDLRFDPSLGVKGNDLQGGEERVFVNALRATGGEVVWVPEMTVQHYVDPSRLQISYLIRLSKDRGASTIRRKGIPPGVRVLGVPLSLVAQYAREATRAGLWLVVGQPIKAAGHLAKAESFRGKLIECQRMKKRSGAPA